MKIKIERPNEVAAAQIFARYLTTDLPLATQDVQDSVAAIPRSACRA